MMKLKKHIVATSFAIALFCATPNHSNDVHAKVDVAKAMDSMWNATTPEFSKGGVNGAYTASLGGLNARVPVRNIQIVAFDPPRLEAGCGGIDAYFGSFSLISTENIKQAMGAIISNAAGYALNLALENVCPSCRTIYYDLQDLTQKVSIDAYNTCQLGSEAVDWISGKMNPSNRNSVSETENLQQANEGHSKDLHDSRIKTQGNPKANRDDNADAKDAKYGNNLLNTYISAGVFSTDNLQTDIFGGDEEFFKIAMSLIGTNILTTGSNKENNDTYVGAIWNFQHLVDGSPTGSEFTILSCADGFSSTQTNKCQNVQHKQNSWSGTKRYVINLLLGKQSGLSDNDSMGASIATKIEPDSIIAYIRNPKAVQLDSTRRAFFDSLSPLDKEILSQVAQLTDTAVISTSQTISEFYAKQLAAKLAQAIVQETRQAYTTQLGNKKHADLSQNQEQALQKLEYDAKQVLQNSLHDNKTLTDLIAETVKLAKQS